MLSFVPKNQLTRLLIYGFAALIIGSSLWYSNYLANQLAEKERKSVQLFADALDFTANMQLDDANIDPRVYESWGFIQEKLVIDNYNLVPTMLVDESGTILSTNNISFSKDPNRSKKQMESTLLDLKSANEPIKISFAPGRFQYIYYGESDVLRQLRWFPFIQISVAAVFITVVFIGFAIAKRNEQNRVWVGLAKETAHQLGTPVSSLMAWIELLKLTLEDRPEEMEYLDEMERDIKRLEMIADRFSKIGSTPELEEVSLKDQLEKAANYISKRMTQRGTIGLNVINELPEDSVLMINTQLFDWVIENLLKNALDSISTKKGEITIHAAEGSGSYYIDVTDTGKGIPKANFKKVFEPGFTTKKRGWGLGLSLSKRIIENYHKGKIFVKESEVDKGVTFRIILPKRG